MIRIGAIAVLYIAIALIYVGRLLYLQVSGQDYYSMSTPSRTYSRTVKIQAQRGEIFDRNGNPLVYNNYSHNIALDYASLPADDNGIVFTEAEMQALERTNIANALQRCHGKIYGDDGAAALLGISPTTLCSRIKKFGLRKQDA